MATVQEDVPQRGTPRERGAMSREQALRIAERKKAARRLRTRRIRQVVVALAAAAFVGPLGVIATRMAEGRDPVLAAKQIVHTALGDDSAAASASGDDAGGGSSNTTAAPSPAPVTTRQS